MTKPIHSISSTASMHSFGTTGAVSASPSTGGWSSLSTTKTASFSAIQKEVSLSVASSPGHTYKAYNPAEAATQSLFTEQPGNPRRNSERDDQLDDTNTSTGQLKPGSPVGDMLLPMLVITVIYIIVKLLRKHKTSQAL